MVVLFGLFQLSSVTVFVLLFYSQVQSQRLPERFTNKSACYSTDIGLQCSREEVIAINAVYAGAKLRSTSCMSVKTIVNTSNPFCCERDHDRDCITPYFNQQSNLTYVYHYECTGQEVCAHIPVQWMTVASDWCTNHTHYNPETNYMAIDYYCINKTDIGVLPVVSLAASAGSAVYLQGQQYPGFMAQATYSSCSLESSCGGGVSIQAIHIDFDKDNGVCQQDITISDTSDHTKHITCDDNNNYKISEVFTTSAHDVTLNICSRQGNGKFWIGFISTSDGCFTLSCQAVPSLVGTLCTSSSTSTYTSSTSAVTGSSSDVTVSTSTVTGSTSAYTGSTSTVIVSGSTVTVSASSSGPSVTDSVVNTNPPTQENDTGGGSLTTILSIVAAILLLIILVVLLLRWKHKKQKNTKVATDKADNVNHDPESDDHNEDLSVLRDVPFSASKAPWATSVTGLRGKTLEPITPKTTEIPEQGDQKKKKKKRRRKKKKRNKEEDGNDIVEEIRENDG